MGSKTPLTDKAVFRCHDEGREVVDPEFARELEIDAARYLWLRAQYAAGQETYLAESMMGEDEMDKYIDERLAGQGD